MPSKLNWPIEEQTLLKQLKQVSLITSWKRIAQILNQKFVNSSRSGKQCRDRYINYIRFDRECPKVIGWTSEQDKQLFDKFQVYGAKWVQISLEMRGRSENNLKNRFYGAMRKIMRKIAKVEKEFKPKPKKLIKQKQLIKLFEQCRNAEQAMIESTIQHTNQNDLMSGLYKKLISLAITQQEEISNSEVKNIITAIHQYNNIGNKVLSRRKSESTSTVSVGSFYQHQERDSIMEKQFQNHHLEKRQTTSTSLDTQNQENDNNSCFQWVNLGEEDACQKSAKNSYKYEDQIMKELDQNFNFSHGPLPEIQGFFF